MATSVYPPLKPPNMKKLSIFFKVNPNDHWPFSVSTAIH